MKRILLLILICPMVGSLFGCQYINEAIRDYHTLDDDKVYYYAEKPYLHRHSIYVGEGNGGKFISPPAGSSTGFHSKEGNMFDGLEED